MAFLGLSEYKITSGPDPVLVTLTLPTDAESLAEGERLAKTRGCTGCHMEDLAGQIFFDDPIFARLVAPNLTHIMKTEPVETLEAAMRQGIGIDGRPLVLMASPMYSYMSDEDTAKIIAYLKTMPEVENNFPDNFFGPIIRWLFILGEFKTAPAMIAENPPLRFNTSSNPELVKSEYLAMTMCTECHGGDMKGIDEGDFHTPNLTIIAAYSYEEFAHFMKTGEATGGRVLGLMTEVAKSRTAYLFEEEIALLYAFLIERAENEMNEGIE